MWADGVPNVVKRPLSPTEVAPSEWSLDVTFPACVVTCAACRATEDVVEPECLELPVLLPVDQLAGSQAELVAD